MRFAGLSVPGRVFAVITDVCGQVCGQDGGGRVRCGPDGGCLFLWQCLFWRGIVHRRKNGDGLCPGGEAASVAVRTMRLAGDFGEFRGICRMTETMSGTGHIVHPYGRWPVSGVRFLPKPECRAGRREIKGVNRSFRRIFGRAVCRNGGNGNNQGRFPHFFPFPPVFPIGSRITEHRLNPIGKKYRHGTEMTGRR